MRSNCFQLKDEVTAAVGIVNVYTKNIEIKFHKYFSFIPSSFIRIYDDIAGWFQNVAKRKI